MKKISLWFSSDQARRAIFGITLFALGLFGAWLLLRSTPYGLGLVNDSATYIGGAQNLLSGHGYVRSSGAGELKPITHFPPLFSLLLAACAVGGTNLVQAARSLIVVLFGLDVMLIGLVSYKISRNYPFALLSAALFGFSDTFLGIYSFALSEPLFLTLALLSLLLLAEAFDRDKFAWLALSGFVLGLVYLTRYAGTALWMTVILALVLLLTDWRQPLRRAQYRQVVALLSGSLPPVIVWTAYTMVSGSEVGNRQIAWHPVSLQALFEAIKNLLSVFAPQALLAAFPLAGRAMSALALLLLPALLLILILEVKNIARRANAGQRPSGSQALVIILALFIWLYLVFLVVSISLFDASTPLNDRILSVIFLAELLLLPAGLAWLWKVTGGKLVFARALVIVLCAGLILTTVQDGLRTAAQLSRDGQGFAQQGWRESRAIQDVKSMSPVIIYSNKPTAIYLLTGKSAYITPTKIDAVTLKTRPEYVSDLEQMKAQIRRGEAVLVLFGLRDSTDPEERDLLSDLTAGLRLQADYGESLIYAAQP